MGMTVGELRSKLENHPDDMPVMLMVEDKSATQDIVAEIDIYEVDGPKLFVLVAETADRDDNGDLL